MNKVLKISECEEMVMRAIWVETEAPDLATITQNVNEKFDKAWRIQTVSTFLTRLQKKNWLEIQGERRRHCYKPLISLDTYRKEKLKETLELFEEATDELMQIIDNWIVK